MTVIKTENVIEIFDSFARDLQQGDVVLTPILGDITVTSRTVKSLEFFAGADVIITYEEGAVSQMKRLDTLSIVRVVRQ